MKYPNSAEIVNLFDSLCSLKTGLGKASNFRRKRSDD